MVSQVGGISAIAIESPTPLFKEKEERPGEREIF
jgi:hypothetical protein